MNNTSVLDIIMRQTDYDEEKALSKLKEHNNDHMQVIKEYMGIKSKKEKTCAYVSQQRYKIIRSELDAACKSYRDKQEGIKQ